jgi:hypothetical protein
MRAVSGESGEEGVGVANLARVGKCELIFGVFLVKVDVRNPLQCLTILRGISECQEI